MEGLQHWMSDLTGRASAIVSVGLLLVVAFAWLGHWTARHEAALKDRWRRLRERPQWQAWQKLFDPQIDWLHSHLSPTGYLGLRLTQGVVVIIGAAWLFGGVAEDVVHRDPLTQVDVVLAQWLQDHATAGLTAFALAVSRAHGAAPVILVTAMLCVLFGWRQELAWLLITLLAVPGGMLLNWGLKLAFQRPRPTVGTYGYALQSYISEWHTVAATLFYGLVAAYLVSIARSWTQRVTIVWLALACIVVVAFSRLYLGVHYLSDVLAAMCVGAFWLALCTTAVHTLAAARETRNRTAGTTGAMPATNQQEGNTPR